MAITKKTLKLEGLDCASCCLMIDDVLEEMEGVASSKTSYAKQVCQVEFDPEKVLEEDIVSAIEQGGYTVLQ